MSEIQTNLTVKERLARIEILLCNHLKHHETHNKWMMGLLSGALVGMFLLALPWVIKGLTSLN